MNINSSFSKGNGSFILRSKKDASVGVIGKKMKRLLSVTFASSVESDAKSQKTSDDDRDVEISPLPYNILFKSPSSGDLSQKYNIVLKRTKSETDITPSEEFDYSKLDKQILTKKIMSFFQKDNLEAFKVWGEQNSFCSDIYEHFFPKNETRFFKLPKKISLEDSNEIWFKWVNAEKSQRQINDENFQKTKSYLPFDFHYSELSTLALSNQAITQCVGYGNVEIRKAMVKRERLAHNINNNDYEHNKNLSLLGMDSCLEIREAFARREKYAITTRMHQWWIRKLASDFKEQSSVQEIVLQRKDLPEDIVTFFKKHGNDELKTIIAKNYP